MRSTKEVSEGGQAGHEEGWEGRGGRDTGSFSAESWLSCSHTGPSSPPSTPASQSAGDKTRPLQASVDLSDTTFGCFIVNIFTTTSKR